MANKVVRKAYKSKQEYKTIKIKEENIPSMIRDINKVNKIFKNRTNCLNYSNPLDTPEGIIDRLQKYKSIKIPIWVYNNMVLLRNDLIRMGYDNWLPHIKRAMKHRINPVTGNLTNYRLVTMGDIVNLAFVQLRFELKKDNGVELAEKAMSFMNMNKTDKKK